jgi:predicted methyltransferase
MDDFDRFIDALGPEEREPDRMFVTRVQAQVRLEERLAAERRRLQSRLALELLAIAAVTGGLAVLASAPAIGEFAAQSPATAIAGMVTAFGFVVATFRTFAARTTG